MYRTIYEQKRQSAARPGTKLDPNSGINPNLAAVSGLPTLKNGMTLKADPAENIKPDKEKSTEKIDGALATIIVLDRAIRNRNKAAGPVYDDQGILML